MALSIIDRLLGRTEPLPVVDAKAVTGPGAFAMTYHTPLHSFSRDPHRLMAEAQGLFQTNGWVAAAERALGGRFIRMDWHLEDGDGETVDETSPEPFQQVLRLLERPSSKARHKLWGITFRHLGLCGNAFWYLDQRDLAAGTPLQLLYINPARMTPSVDEGGNVTGWVLDHPENQAVNARTTYQSRTGIPLSTEEVIHFTMDEPDWGIWGVGIAESAQRKIELDRLTEGHAGGVLASGGRLSGLVSPKAGTTVTDDQWVQFVRDWRSITSDPDAAKRLQIAKMPLDFTQMTASPKDLQLIDITKQNRDDIFALWGVPKGQRGMDTPAGLNADRATGDEATVWETTKERSEPFRESVQIELLDRFGALGVDVTLVLDYPEFDEDTGQFENAALARTIPMTIDQRLEQVGLDPLDETLYGDLGKSIYLDQSMVRVDTIGVPPVRPTNVVAGPTEPEPNPIDTSTEDEEEVVEGKADLSKPLLGLRAKTETVWEPKLRKVVARVLGEQERMVISKLEHAVRKNDLSWWNDKREAKRFADALSPLIEGMAAEVVAETAKVVKKPAKADSFLETVIAAIRKGVGDRIKGINDTTRDKVRAAIAAGVDAGESPADIGVRVRESAAFDEYRAELVSRTETAQVYNDAALGSYRELEVTEVDAIDGDTDAECAARNGKRYPIDEAMGISDHPNGTLDWIPVVKAEVDPEILNLKAHISELEARPPTVINVTTPDVTVHTPDIAIYPQFHAPEVTVTVPPAKATTKTVVRDEAGRIDKVIEE